MKYKATFVGRQLGAIGIVYRIDTEVEADNRDTARMKLYERFEHVQFLRLEEVKES